MDLLIQQLQDCSFHHDCTAPPLCYTRSLEPTFNLQGVRTKQWIPENSLLGPIQGCFKPIYHDEHPYFLYLDDEMVLDYSEQIELYGIREPITYIVENNQTTLPTNCCLAINELGQVFVKTLCRIEANTELVYDMYLTETFYRPL